MAKQGRIVFISCLGLWLSHAPSAKAACLSPAAKAREFVAFARTLGATRDLSERLEDVLEPEQVAGACERHFARVDAETGKLPNHLCSDADAVADMLRCGKWLFFSADFASKMAIPENILTAMPELFGQVVGPAFSKTGLIENPFEPGLPIGFVRLESSPWGVLSAATGPARGIACATCHFGKLPDGRYAAGMPNQQLDFGKVNALLMYSAWRADFRKEDATVWPLDLQAFYRSLDHQLANAVSPARTLFDVAWLVSWLRSSDSFYTFTGASRPVYAEASTWLSGTANQYYASSPLLPVSGKSYWMSAPATWDLTYYEGEFIPGHTRPLSSFTPMKNAEDFVALAFIFQTGMDTYAQAKFVDALVLYMRALKTPENLDPPDIAAVASGRRLFTQYCRGCHNGISGETLQAYPAVRTATPAVLVDPLRNYVPPKPLSGAIYRQTLARVGYPPLTNHGIFSRALKGIYTRRHLMLNGSVADVNAAFCLGSERKSELHLPAGLQADVHLDLCTDYSEVDKQDLIAFLNAWY